MSAKKHKSFQRPKSGRKTKTALLMCYFVESSNGDDRNNENLNL